MGERHDLLLEWISEKGAGTWREFRESHDWLFRDELTGAYGDPAYRTLITMSTLGQVEIDWGESRWAAAPPVLTVVPSGGANALLAGSRTRALTSALRAATDEEVTQDYLLNVCPQDGGPSAFFVAAEDETAVERLAHDVGVGYEYSVPGRISQLLPTLVAYLAAAAGSAPPRGYEAETWDPQAFRWRTAVGVTNPGLYRFKTYGRHRYRWVGPAGDGHEVDYTWGAYAELRARNQLVLQFVPDGATGTLWVPAQFPLPTLHGRSAALCSGLVPRPVLRAAVWGMEFVNVTPEVCERIAASLGQLPVRGLRAGATGGRHA